jgi:DNA-binding transcriptional regulator YdaS (Cro superfamily)
MTRYLGPMKQHPRRKDLDRLVRLAGSQRRLAEALGTTEETVSRWMSGTRGIPPHVSVIAELIDKLPAERWPERWQ